MRQLALRRSGRVLVMPVQHLSATEIASFIDSTLPPDARVAAELHLSGCPRCREELASCLRLASTAPMHSRWRTTLPLAGAIAAAILVVAVLRPNLGRHAIDVARERTPALPPSGALAVMPAPNSAIPRRDVQLIWRRDADAVSYRAIIADSSGAPAWRSSDIVDTSVTPPPSLSLTAGARYYWRVDILHADGSTAQSATTGFRIVP